MQLTCPSCFARFPLEAALNDDEARHALARAFEFPPALAKPVMRYLACFAPRQRALQWPRVVRLLDELVPAIRSGRVVRHGREWAAPIEAWQMALDTVLRARDAGKLRLPLKSHGYLFEIVAAAADSAEARDEAATEAKRRTGAQRSGPRTVPSPVQAMLDAKLAELTGGAAGGAEASD